MSKPAFTKGQKVNVYFGDFYTANVLVKSYTVGSCGQKQMHLIRDDGSNALFRVSAPYRAERMYFDVQCATVDPVEHAAARRKIQAAWTREHFADRTATAEKRLLENPGRGSEGDAKVIAEGKAKFEAATADINF